MTKIIAHRGDTSTFPENTLEAFEAAEKAGADGIELDVHATSDGKLIVHHDYYLGSPDNGYGIITDVPYSIIKDLTIEGRYYIPKLQDVFDRINNSFHYEIELKCLTLPAAEDVIALSKRHSLLDHIEFTSPHPYLLPRLKEKYPSITTGVFAMSQPEWMDNSLYNKICINQALLGSFNVLHVQSERITSELVHAAHKEKLLIHAADCNSVKELKRVIKLGVDQLSTDIVETALRITGGDM